MHYFQLTFDPSRLAFTWTDWLKIILVSWNSLSVSSLEERLSQSDVGHLTNKEVCNWHDKCISSGRTEQIIWICNFGSNSQVLTFGKGWLVQQLTRSTILIKMTQSNEFCVYIPARRFLCELNLNGWWTSVTQSLGAYWWWKLIFKDLFWASSASM